MESTSSSTFISKKSKVLLATVLALCIVGVAVAVIATTRPSARAEGASEDSVSEREVLQGPHTQDDDRKHVLDTSAVKLPQTGQRLKRASQKLLIRDTRSVKNPHLGGEDMTSCYSESSNDTIPAAHIAGHGGKNLDPSTSQSSIIRRGYRQKWRCNGYLSRYGFHAFVDGGMIFNQMDKSLQVPVCGYYHIMSQVLFELNVAQPLPAQIYHSLKFKNNCGENQPDELAVIGSNMISGNQAKATTHTSDVVHLCEGAKVWVEIPDGPNRNPCCPKADEDQTFIAAYLIAQTSCEWPRAISYRRQ